MSTRRSAPRRHARVAAPHRRIRSSAPTAGVRAAAAATALLCAFLVPLGRADLLAGPHGPLKVASSDPLPSAGTFDGVDYTPFADFKSRPLLGTDRLVAGDFLSSSAGPGFVVVESEDGKVSWQFTRPFRVLFLDVGGEVEKIELSAGNVTVRADQPTETHSGGVVLASSGTVYSVRVGATADMQGYSCAVLEGSVVVRTKAGWQPVAPGNVLEAKPSGAWERREIDAKEVVDLARQFARADVGRALVGGRGVDDADSLLRSLGDRYHAVFRGGGRAGDYVELATTQLGAGLVDAAVANIHRADGEVEPFDVRTNARISFAKAIAAEMSGRREDATALYRAAHTLDAEAMAEPVEWSPRVKSAVEDLRKAAGPLPEEIPRDHDASSDRGLQHAKSVLLGLGSGAGASRADVSKAWWTYREAEGRPGAEPLSDERVRDVVARLAEAGLVRETTSAHELLAARGSVTSRDALVLARALAARRLEKETVEAARRATLLHASDGQLTEKELAEARHLAGMEDSTGRETPVRRPSRFEYAKRVLLGSDLPDETRPDQVAQAWQVYAESEGAAGNDPFADDQLRAVAARLAGKGLSRDATAAGELLVARGRATSRDHLVLARLLTSSGDREKAAAAATRALELHGTDALLTEREVAEARLLARGR